MIHEFIRDEAVFANNDRLVSRHPLIPAPAEILLLTASTGLTESFADVTCRNMARYCARHGYAFCRRRDGFRVDRPPAWSKPSFIADYLRYFELVVWIDVDVLIMDQSKRLDQAVDLIGNWDILLAEEVFPHRRNANSGVLFVRNTEFSRAFWEAIEHAPCDPNDRWYEQRAVAQMLEHPRVAARVRVVPQRSINSMLLNDSYLPGDFILHFAGLDERKTLISEYVESVDDPDTDSGPTAEWRSHVDGEADIGEILNAFAARHEDAYFIQVGSHDGVTRDPLRRIAERHHWCGVCVEAVADIYERLVVNARGLPIECEHATIAAANEVRQLIRLPSDSFPLPMFFDQLATLKREVLFRRQSDIAVSDRLAMEDRVSCRTLDDLERKFELCRIDVLHIDAEGMDIEILRSAPLERWQTKLVILEHKHHGSEEICSAIETLKDRQFSVYVSGDDLVGVHADVHADCFRKWEVAPIQDPAPTGSLDISGVMFW